MILKLRRTPYDRPRTTNETATVAHRTPDEPRTNCHHFSRRYERKQMPVQAHGSLWIPKTVPVRRSVELGLKSRDGDDGGAAGMGIVGVEQSGLATLCFDVIFCASSRDRVGTF